MWPFRTVTEPKRLRCESACSPSSVTQPPLRVHRPEGHMGEDDQRSAAAQTLDIFLEPVELSRPEASHSARFEVEHVDESDEVDPFVVKALPTGARRPVEASEVFLAAIGEHVVLAGNVEHARGPRVLESFGHRVEGSRFLSMSDVARMNDERRGWLEGLDPCDGLRECAERIRIRFSLEADVRVTDLHEAEVEARLGCRGGA